VLRFSMHGAVVCVWVLFFLMLSPLSLQSQEAPKATGTQASISGTVMDQTGAVIPGASVVLSRGPQAKPEVITPEVITDDKGIYAFRALDAGTYTLTVTAPNFAAQSLTDITLAAGQELSLDVTLLPQSAQSKVNVEAEGAAQVEVENATVAGTITQKEVVQIGLNGRNFTQLIALAPGVSNQTGQDEAKVGVQGSVKYSVNGGRVEYNTFEVDGSDVLNTGLNGAVSTLMVYPSLDAIQEVKVLTSNYGAQYGRTASGTVQVTTKSGGNTLHGNIYEFIRNEAFNSRNYFDITSSKAPLYRRQDFGGTIGGPLTIPHVYNANKTKTFFFFSEEARLEKTPTDYNQAVPSLKERGLVMTPQGARLNLATENGITYQDFDFSDVCPLLSATPPFTRQQYPDCPAVPGSSPSNLQPVTHLNQVQQSGLASSSGVDKNALTLLDANLIPIPNSQFGCNYNVPSPDPSDPNHCYDATVSPPTYWREELFKIDHNLTSKSKVSFRYVHDAWDTTVLTPQWAILRTTNPGAATFPTIQNRFVGPGTDLVARFTHVFSTTWLNDLVLSYANSTITLTDKNGPGGAVFQLNPSLGQPLVADPSAPGQCNPLVSADPATLLPQCGMGYIFNNGFGGKMPGFEILGTNAAYGGRGFAADASYMPWGHTNPTYSMRDDVFKSLGHHTLQFGGQVVYSQRNQTNNAIGAASGELQGFLTFSNLVRSTGNAFADFLLQTVPSPGSPPQSLIQSFTQDSAQHRYYQRFEIGEPYLQDDWKVTPRLTLNLGLRVSLFGMYSEKNKNAWNWEAAKFSPTMFAVDPCSGVLLLTAMATCQGNAVQFNAATNQIEPSLVSELGLVQCGANGIPGSCMAAHLVNPAPRVGFALDPKGDGKMSIRGGYGIFFEHGTGNEANTGSLEASAPLVLSMTEPLPLSYPCIGNVGYGAAFNSTYNPCANPVGFAAGATAPPAGSVFPLNVTAIPTKAVWPYAQQWSFGIQRQLPSGFLITVSYVGSRGTHLTLERNLNQLPDLPLNENPFSPNEPLTETDCTTKPAGLAGVNPGDGTMPFLLENGTLVMPSSPAYVHMQAACSSPNIPNVNSLPRPYPGLGQVLSLENVATSTYHAMQATMRRISGPLTLGVSYSYSHSIDNSSDRSDPVLVDSYNLRGNRASSNFDERHLLNISYIYALSSLAREIPNWTMGHAGDPTGDGQDVSKKPSHFVEVMSRGWEVEGITLFQSGTPFTVINNAGNTGISLTDNAGVASGFGIAESFPDVLRGQPKAYGNAQSFGPLLGNPNEFVAPRGLTFGNAGRNFLNNPSRLNFDLSLIKHFKPTESSDLQFRAEAFNVFNHTEFRIYDPDNPGGTGNNVISCYAGPQYSAGFIGQGGADCLTGASFLHPIDAHRARTVQFGLKLGF
jgi:Carboxypeptidase regulatory-like domain